MATVEQRKCRAEHGRKQVPDYRRNRILARSIRRRILIRSDGRPVVAGKVVSFQELARWLERQESIPELDRDSLTNEFPLLLDGELDESVINAQRLALQRWQNGLLTERNSSRQSRRDRRKLDDELQETRVLARRLVGVIERGRIRRCGQSAASEALFLDAEAERAFAQRLKSFPLPLEAVVVWLSRFVCWWAGPEALDRFLDALQRLHIASADLRDLPQLESLAAQFHVLEIRAASEHRRQIHAEAGYILKETSNELLRKRKLPTRRSCRSIRAWCAALSDRCFEIRTQRQDNRLRRLPAILAAMCCCDGSSVRIPNRLVADPIVLHSARRCREWAGFLVSMSELPAYDKLLLHLDELPDRDLKAVRGLLALGETVDNICWAEEHTLLHLDWKLLSPGWIRSFYAVLSKRSIPVSLDQLRWLLDDVKSPDQFQLLQEFSDWLRRIPCESFTPRLADQARVLIHDLVLPAITEFQYHDLLRSWMNRTTVSVAEIPATAVKSDLRRTMSSIAHYRRLAGESSLLPESWRRELMRPARAASELAWLRMHGGSRTCGEHVQARIANLNLQTRPDAVNQRRLLRKSHRVLLTVASDSLRRCIRQRSIEVWHDAVGFSCAEITGQFPNQFARWVQSMNSKQRVILRSVLESWRSHGGDYRRHLPANEVWLVRAGSKIDVDQWLHPEPATVDAGGRRIRIRVSDHPVQTFLMGQHFGTCLSLNDCNRLSALTNAYDANKQVLYVENEDGSLLGRQLVTISSNWKLLGYHCYFKVPTRDEHRRTQLTNAVHEFCGLWACRCRLPLGNEGEPETIDGHFWYDDCEVEWWQAARNAWQEEALRRSRTLGRRETVPAESCSTPRGSKSPSGSSPQAVS